MQVLKVDLKYSNSRAPLACRGAIDLLRLISHFATFNEMPHFDPRYWELDCFDVRADDLIAEIEKLGRDVPGSDEARRLHLRPQKVGCLLQKGCIFPTLSQISTCFRL